MATSTAKQITTGELFHVSNGRVGYFLLQLLGPPNAIIYTYDEFCAAAVPKTGSREPVSGKKLVDGCVILFVIIEKVRRSVKMVLLGFEYINVFCF